MRVTSFTISKSINIAFIFTITVSDFILYLYIFLVILFSRNKEYTGRISFSDFSDLSPSLFGQLLLEIFVAF